MIDSMLLFSTQNYLPLARKMLDTGAYGAGKVELRSFPDGEHYYRIISDVQYRDVILLGGTVNDQDTLELYDLACGLVELGARKLNLVVPYFGYSTMERAVKTGEIVTAKTRARLLSAIPQAYFGNRIICMDLHSEGIPQYFEGAIRPIHLYAKPVIMEAARQLAGDDFVLASTDAGRAKWVESLANDMGVEAAFVYKRRVGGSETMLTGVNADVKNKNVVIYDDMIRTGGSLKEAARAYKEAGANSIFVTATHGIFCNGAVESLRNCGLIEAIAVTDTHPNTYSLPRDFIKVVSIWELLHKTLLSLGRPAF